MNRNKMSIFRMLAICVALVGAISMTACDTTGKKGGMEGDDAEMQEKARGAGYMDAAGSLQDVFFDFDRSEIRSDQRDILMSNAEWIKANGDVTVQIEGHCDERGTAEYNLALGERRANAVRDFIVSYGIDPNRIFTISYGEEIPVDPGHTEDSWGKNRRAHFLITK